MKKVLKKRNVLIPRVSHSLLTCSSVPVSQLSMLFIMAFSSLLTESLPPAEVLCQNVTFAEHYIFIWKEKNIEQVNVTVFLGSLCDGGIMKFLLQFLMGFLLQRGSSMIESLIY